jgi:RNA polymerase sigma-70 factor (ECF subfamily)
MSDAGTVPGDEAPDDVLIQRFVAGDGRAFDQIVARYERRVYSIALRMCGDPDDARDVTQDVFVSALRALRRFRGDAQLSTWLHRVAVNSSLDSLRRRSRRRDRDELNTEMPSGAPGPEEHAVASARAAEVQAALRKISDEHRAVLVLHDLQGCDYAEVASALDIPLGTVKSRIHRARLEMARLLGHLREAEPASAPDPLNDA